MASGSDRNPIIIGGLPSQVPDFDPEETAEWLDSLDAAIETAKDLAKANPGTGSYEIRPVAELHDYHLAEQRKTAA